MRQGTTKKHIIISIYIFFIIFNNKLGVTRCVNFICVIGQIKIRRMRAGPSDVPARRAAPPLGTTYQP